MTSTSSPSSRSHDAVAPRRDPARRPAGLAPPRRRTSCRSSASTSSSALRLWIGLATKRQRAGVERALARLVGRDDAHRDVPRRDVVLQPLQHAPAVDVGQVDVERDRVGLVLAGHGQRGGAQRGDQPLEALLARGVEQDAGEARGRSRRSAARGRRAGSSSRSSPTSLTERGARRSGSLGVGCLGAGTLVSPSRRRRVARGARSRRVATAAASRAPCAARARGV